MTGFIRGLFGGKRQPQAPKPPRNTGAYFLSEDEAKTLGDIDYMRSSKVVKRTFARKKGQTEEVESVRQVSAMEKRDLNKNGIATQVEETTSFPVMDTPEPPKFQRRKADDNLDMFRKMARDMKK
jgi:hypothetical protein